ncbi:MAG TPA: ribonuclease Y [Candidatus Paceibacterota bacterium]|nr:ribonuclease Y [Candidatus Paceibacterota bacterium]
MNETLLALGMLLAGGLLGYSIRAVIFIIRKNNLEFSIAERLIHAKESAQKIVDEAHARAEALLAEVRTIEKEKEDDLKTGEERLIKKEALLDARQSELDSRANGIEERAARLIDQEKEIETIAQLQQERLEAIAGFSADQARAALIKTMEEHSTEDLQTRARKLDQGLRDALNERARNILVTTIQRLAIPATSELTTSTIAIDNDELKGKIIGKEGRNIRTFERISGTELLVDESPGTIVVSCFDPVRRAIAVQALTTLLKDGRIQPARIEEELEKSRAAIHDQIKEKGAAAVYECGIYNFDPRLIAILGRLHFRTSYGQNVLQHSIEMAHIAEMIASEVGADAYIAKAGALVHDIGKALDHEFEGTHVAIGIKVLRRFGTDERIITAMKSHHDDTPHESLEAVIVQTADMISGARPGARRDTTELYIKRLTDLERLAAQFTGVEKAYALQAGREIRIFVHPEHISDTEAHAMARAIAITIETELRYPGEIKVTVIRETRVTDYAR